MSRKWGSYTAYYWPENRRVGVDYVLSKRDPYNMRAGDCWCHKDCYDTQTGRRVFPRDYESSGLTNKRNHFWVGSGGSGSKLARTHPKNRRLIPADGCVVSRRVKLLGEDTGSNNYYEQFFSDLKAELTGSSNMWDNIDTYCIQRVEFPKKNQRNASDLIIHHTPGNRDLTHVVIVNMSSKRKWPQNLYANERTKLNTILIDIGKWKDNHVADFASFGKRKFKEEWDKLNSRIIRHNKQVDLDRKRDQERAKREIEKRNHALIELNDAMAEVRRILVEGNYGFNDDDLRKSVDGLRWKIEFAQKRGIDTAPAEALRKEALEELDRVSMERAERNERTALARGYIPRLKIIGITSPDLTEYEDVISLFEQHEGEIREAENEAWKKEVQERKRKKKAAGKKLEDELRARQEWVQKGNDLLRELETNRTTYRPVIEILEFADERRVKGYWKPDVELPHAHIELLRIILRQEHFLQAWKPHSRMLETWVTTGKKWSRIGIVPLRLRRQLAAPGNQIGHEELLQNARAELDAIIPIYKDYFKDLEIKQEKKLSVAGESLESQIESFESEVDQLDTLTLMECLNLTGPLLTALREYERVPGAKTALIGRTNKLVEDTEKRAKQEDARRADEKKNRLQEERDALKPLEDDLDGLVEGIVRTGSLYSLVRNQVESLMEKDEETIKIGNERILKIDEEISYSEIHCPSDFEQNQTEIEGCKEKISIFVAEAESNMEKLERYTADYLTPIYDMIENMDVDIKKAQLPENFWDDENPERKTDLEKRIGILNHYEGLEAQVKDAEEFWISEKQDRSTNNSLNRIRHLDRRARSLCDSRLRGILDYKDVSFWGKIVEGRSQGALVSPLDLGMVPREYRHQTFFVHGSDFVGGESVFTYKIKKGCELRFKPVLGEYKGKEKLQAKEVTHYLCPNCSDSSDSPPPLKDNPTGSETNPLPVGQAIKNKQEKKNRAKKLSKLPEKKLTGKNRPKKPKKGKRLPTTRGGPKKRKGN